MLGELLVGVVLGNLGLAGVSWLDPIKADPSIDLLARIGVLLLLFEVGLESAVSQMLEVGLSALLVAALGVVAPFALGWGVGAWLLPDSSAYVHAFLGATLSATSVGITARVLNDLGCARSPEARVILGAAVVDDVLGLVILAVVTGLIAAAGTGAPFSYGTVLVPLFKATAFLAGALLVGVLLSRKPAASGSQYFKGVLAIGLLMGLGIAIVVVSQSSLDVRPGDEAAAERECEDARHRFGDAEPYVVVQARGEHRVATVRSGMEPRHPASIRNLRGIAWSPGPRRLLHLSTPYWVFKATRWKGKALAGIVRPFHQQLGLDFELPDLERLGPGLVLDERDPDGRRVVVWTE